jgi:hypothetical protein
MVRSSNLAYPQSPQRPQKRLVSKRTGATLCRIREVIVKSVGDIEDILEERDDTEGTRA